MTNPDPTPVLDSLDGFRRSKAMFAALELGVFERLHRSPANAETVARELKLDAEAAERLLDTCVEAETQAPDVAARVAAARAMLARDPAEGASLARDAVAAAERTDDLNLQAAMHMTLARVSGDAREAEAARALYAAKGNVAAAASTGLWSLQT